MDSMKVDLIILTDSEKSSWLYEQEYTDAWPEYGQARFLKANQVSKGPGPKHKYLQVKRNSTIIELIEAAKQLFPEFGNDSECEFPITYSILSPISGYNSLPETSRLSDLDITSGDILVLKRTVNVPFEDIRYSAIPIKNFEHFQRMVSANGSLKQEEYSYPDRFELYATLLYTEEDIDLVTFVRENFDNLHKMSGPDLLIYVVEKPPQGSNYAAATFWKARLEKAVYLAWSLLGWISSKPYDKSDAYEIARNLGIYPDQLPCLAIFYDPCQSDKIVFPVTEDYSHCFRTILSNIQRILINAPNDRKALFEKAMFSAEEAIAGAISLEEQEFLQQRGRTRLRWDEQSRIEHEVRNRFEAEANREIKANLFESIRTACKKLPTENDLERSAFNFYGHTVFINNPTGSFRPDNFQNVESEKE